MNIPLGIFSIFVLSSIIHEGSALQCYNCTASVGAPDACANVPTLNNTNYVTCATVPVDGVTFPHTHCMTHLTNTTVRRECAYNDTCSNLTQCYLCTGNLCNIHTISNAGFTLTMSTYAIIGTLLTVLKLSL
ncbi:hypothetical protein JTB14_036834 [Gonioctena quinquepunctata]|nr:hypothetical protein JTB14_036834 [Gonioctena quinquepunctata]